MDSSAPRLRVVAGVERHATVDRSLPLLCLGSDVVEPVAAERERRRASAPTIVSLQAGNVNTGACDLLRAAIEVVHARNAWVHVDGAFGLWAAASPRLRHLLDGVDLADSWGCAGHAGR